MPRWLDIMEAERMAADPKAPPDIRRMLETLLEDDCEKESQVDELVDKMSSLEAERDELREELEDAVRDAARHTRKLAADILAALRARGCAWCGRADEGECAESCPAEAFARACRA